jgi:hypothetical protein
MLWPNGLPVEPRLSGVESEADFGPRKIGKGFHDGVDYGNHFRVVRSIAAGRVARVQHWNGRTSMQHGNRVWVDHGDGVESSYSHLARIDVEPGEDVDEGQSVGTMGATGYVTGVHLHFEVRVDGRLVDPRPFVRDRIGVVAGGGSTPFEPKPSRRHDVGRVIERKDIPTKLTYYFDTGFVKHLNPGEISTMLLHCEQTEPLRFDDKDFQQEIYGLGLEEFSMGDIEGLAVPPGGGKLWATRPGSGGVDVSAVAKAAADAARTAVGEAIKNLTLVVGSS